MTSHRISRHRLSRLAIAGAFLVTGLAATADVAIASPPLSDAGGPGGGSTIADSPIFLEELGLVSTNDGPGSFTMHPELDGPTLIGSGPEREIVANTDAEVAITGPSLVGSGPEREIVASSSSAGVLDETARANDMLALSPHEYETAAAHRGLPF